MWRSCKIVNAQHTSTWWDQCNSIGPRALKGSGTSPEEGQPSPLPHWGGKRIDGPLNSTALASFPHLSSGTWAAQQHWAGLTSPSCVSLERWRGQPSPAQPIIIVPHSPPFPVSQERGMGHLTALAWAWDCLLFQPFAWRKLDRTIQAWGMSRWGKAWPKCYCDVRAGDGAF